MTRKLTFLILALFALISGPGAKAWGQTTASVELCTNWNQALAYTTSYTHDYIIDNLNGSTTTMTLGVFGVFRQAKTDTYFQMNKKTGYFKNTTKMPGKITKIETTWSNAKGATKCYFATNAAASSSDKTVTVTAATSVTYTPPTDANYYYFNIDVSSGSGSAQMTSCVVYYEATGTSTDPVITVNPTSIDLGTVNIDEEASATFTVSQANLTSNISLSAGKGNLDVTNINAGADDTEVTYTITQNTTGTISDVITISCDNLEEDITIEVTGTAVDPASVVTYEKVTSVNDLVAGASYILVCPSKDKAAGAMGGNAFFSSEDVTLTDNTATSDDAIELVLGGTTGAWTFTTSEGLIGTTAAKSLNHEGNGTTTWTISISGTTGEATITSTATEYGSIKYNASAPRFLNYASGQTAVALYKKAENKAATPTLTESQIFTTKPFEVTITNNEAGATVYYTTNGDDPTTATTTNFTGASTTIQINATTTVKAMAVVEGKANSEIASATYTEQKTDPENQWSAEAYTATIGGENTFPTFSTQSDGAVTYTSSNTNAATIDNTGVITLVAVGTTTITASTTETATYMAGDASYTLTVKEAPLATMDAIFEKATAVGTTATNVEVTFDNWVISGVKNSNAYLTDNNGKGLIIYTSNHGFEVGNILSGTVTCKVQLYNGSAELTNLTATTSGLTVTPNGSITPVEPSIADLGGINTGAVITLNNVTYSGSDNIFTDGEGNEITAYNAFMTLPPFTSGRQYNITGVYIQYGVTKEIAPRDENDIEEIVPTEPSITVAETLELPYTESEETLEVIYQNIDFDNIDINLYDDAECTTDFKGDWFIAEFDDQFNIEYLADENTESTTRTVYMQINYNESELTKVITVTQEAAPQTYNVTLSSNGVVGEPQPVQGSITLSDPINIPTGFTFAGWTESESNIQFVDNPYIPTSNVTLFAVFSREEGGIAGSGNYEKVTSLNDITSGQYVIVNDGYALPNTTSTSTSPVKSDDYMPTIVNDIITNMADNTIWNFTKLVSSITIKNPDGKYLYSTSNNNGLRVNNTEDSWTFEENGSGFAMKDHTNSRYCATYKDGTDWRSYTSKDHANYGDGGILYLYKKDEGTPGTTKYYTRVYNENTTINDNLTVAGPSIILSSYTLTVTGTMSNTSPANLVIEDGAQLIHHNTGVNATVKKSITGYTGDNDNYYLIANPTDNTTVANLINPEGYDLYTFNPAQALEWNYEKESNTLTSGIGYLYANKATTTLEFVGALTPAGSSNIELTYANAGTGIDFPGFNLIGNPYTCNVYLNKPAYVLNGDDFESIDAGTAIAPCQGFFVEATQEDKSVTISTTVPATASQAMSLTVSQNRGNVIDRAIVNFNGSNNLHKFMMNPAHTNLSIAKGSETFAAISTEAEGELPMNFKAEKNGSYTITVDTENVDAEYLHLIDNMTGMDVDLLATPSYTFDAKTSDYASRFKLVFGVKNEASESSDSNFAFMSNGNLVIDNIEGEATLQIVDELGRVISTETVSGSYNKALNLKAGLYIINLNGMTQKIVVK